MRCHSIPFRSIPFRSIPSTQGSMEKFNLSYARESTSTPGKWTWLHFSDMVHLLLLYMYNALAVLFLVLFTVKVTLIECRP